MESRAKGWAVSPDALRKQLGSPRISSADDLVTYQGGNECGARSGLNSDLAVCRGCLSLRTCFGSLCEPLLWIVSCPKDGTVGQRLDYERGQPSTAYPHCPINSNRKRIWMTILRGARKGPSGKPEMDPGGRGPKPGLRGCGISRTASH
jgi:hypothetical protein